MINKHNLAVAEFAGKNNQTSPNVRFTPTETLATNGKYLVRVSAIPETPAQPADSSFQVDAEAIRAIKVKKGDSVELSPNGTSETWNITISGVEGPTSNGGCYGGCGQIDMHLRDHQDEIIAIELWPRPLLARFFEVWQEWHLNDMVAGCQHQEFERKLGHKFCAWPHNLDALCSECGYSYGSRWNCKEVPEGVLAFLVGLPDTDQKPNWI